MDENRKAIVDRANRILKQSRTLRKMSDELLQESHDIRASVKALKQRRGAGREHASDRKGGRKRR